MIAAAPLVFAFTRQEVRAILFRPAEFVVWLSALGAVEILVRFKARLRDSSHVFESHPGVGAFEMRRGT